MSWCYLWICWYRIIRMTQIIRIKEDKYRQQNSKPEESYKIFRCIIWMESQFIRNTRYSFWIIRSIYMKCYLMHYYQSSKNKRLKIMQTKKSIKCCIIYTKATPYKSYLITSYPWYSRQQISYNSGTPETHLTPWQNIRTYFN